MSKQIEKLRNDYEIKLKQADIELIEEKKHSLTLEEQIANLELVLQEKNHNTLKKETADQLETFQSNVYNHQIKALNEALDDAETECFKLLKEKKEKFNKEAIEMCSLTMIDYANKDKLICSVIFRIIIN